MALARWQASITDEQGNIIDQPTITVEREQAGFPLARLYSDRDGTAPITNPFTLGEGEVVAAFHVAGGAYRITATKGTFSRVWRYVAIGLGAETDTPPFVTGGSWVGGSPPTEYEQNVIVSHNGSSYFAIQPNSGVEPGVTPGWEAYWQLLAEKGVQGIQGIQGIQGVQGEQGPAGSGIVDGALLLNELDQNASPAEPPTPSVGTKYVFADVDGKLYSKDSSGTITEVGAGSSVQRRNRIINGAMQISQENGNNSGTSDAYYVADQFCVERNTSAGTITAQRVQSTTPGGATDRARITITTADTSLAAGEYLQFRTRLEGGNVADLLWGTASARPIVLRFLFKGPSGTYAVRIGNSAGNRSYVALFSPSAANTDEIIEIAVAGDTTGTWLTDTGIGLQLSVVLACGSTYQGSVGWQSGNILGTSGVSNGMATGAAVFEMGEFGLYIDPEETGAAPSWELPSRDAELRSCQRFYCKSFPEGIVPANGAGAAEHLAAFAYATGDAQVQRIFFPVEMRTAPTISFYRSLEGSSAGNWARYASGSGWGNMTATQLASGGGNPDVSSRSMCVQMTLSGGFSIGSAYIAAGHWVASARL